MSGKLLTDASMQSILYLHVCFILVFYSAGRMRDDAMMRLKSSLIVVLLCFSQAGAADHVAVISRRTQLWFMMYLIN